MKSMYPLLFILLIVASQLQGQYTYVDLHPDGYDSSKALGIYDGDIVGSGKAAGSTIDHALLWEGVSHTLVDLHPIWATGGSVAYATYNGKQVGRGASGGKFRALLWSGTAESAVDLTPITGYSEAECFDVWENKQVGFGRLMASGRQNPLLWQETADSFVNLNSTDYSDSWAQAVWGNQQVGFGALSQSVIHALLWSDSPESVIDLTPDFVIAKATDVYNGEQVGYGYGVSTGNNEHALLWTGTPESMLDLNPVGFRTTQIVANSNGKQLGWGLWWDYSKHILLWSGSAQDFIYLDAFFPGGNASGITVTDIDADGTIVGYAGGHAFMLVPNSIPYCTSPIEGDLNNDCVLNIFDFVIFSANWMACNLEPAGNCP